MFGIDKKIPALIYAEGEFGKLDGKTANGLVRFSEKYEIIGVIDSTREENYAHEVLPDVMEHIPIFQSLEETLGRVEKKPSAFINGIARDGGAFPFEVKDVFLEAMKNGMSLVTGTHDYLSENDEFVSIAKEYGVDIWDTRKPSDRKDMPSGKLLNDDLPPRIVLVGTDCAIGKRTTGIEICKELERRGYRPTFVATGQTGIMQGAKFGTPLDAVKGDFLSGEVEHEVWLASQDSDVVIVEGQAAISIPQGGVPLALLKGAEPHGAVMIHAPGRKELDGFENYPPPNLDREWEIVEFFYPGTIFAMAINHEGEIDTDEWKERYEKEYGVPVADVLVHGAGVIVDRMEELYLRKEKND